MMIFIDHIYAEEAIMKSSGYCDLHRSACESHMESHADIMASLTGLVSTRQDISTSDLVKRLEQRFMEAYQDHQGSYDDAFIAWLANSWSPRRSSLE